MDIVVEARAGSPVGRLALGPDRWECRVGRSGPVSCKREGDGGTPIGRMALRRLLLRPDRISLPAPVALPVAPIRPNDGWCDDPDHPSYNRPVQCPCPARHEALWRPDPVYDIIVVLGWNDAPVRPGGGSAIFLHLMHADGGPTAGCVALALADMMAVLRRLRDPGDLVVRPEA